MDISKNISSIRESKGIKQYQIAETLGIEPSNYSRLEKRGNKLTIEQLEDLAKALGVTIRELMFGEKLESLEETQSLKARITELESIIRDKEQLNSYLSEKNAVCEEYLQEILDTMFLDIAIDEHSLGTITFIKNGKKEGIRVSEYNDLSEAEQEELYNHEVKYEFSEEETEQTMKSIFTSDKYKKLSGLIMWTGMIKDERFIRYFKKFIMSTNVSLGQIQRLAESKHNPIGIMEFSSPGGFKFKE